MSPLDFNTIKVFPNEVSIKAGVSCFYIVDMSREVGSQTLFKSIGDTIKDKEMVEHLVEMINSLVTIQKMMKDAYFISKAPNN